ncbi:fused MFS/spermidine synthase [Inquilinus sp. CAU 1745]|uniref:fused MFS/spermidine synthase n=1 Tax=Inquilinus sp. CAU 1745 TaxID=3140369 RepID=UPI00325A95D7
MTAFRRHELRRAALFLTGGATLALELVASRIMTPYFGVSLFIWTGILSVTLACLALGYWLGGRVGRRVTPAEAEGLFGMAPAAAGIALVLAGLAYPTALPALASAHLIAGALTGSLLLLGPALVLLSAMNPLLVAAEAQVGGDAGSGSVFAFSTVGSVAGVFAAAFLLIPNLRNFDSYLLVAGALAIVSLAWALAARPVARQTRSLCATLSIVALAAGGFAWTLQKEAQAALAGHPNLGYRIVDVEPTPLATLKVVDIGRNPISDATQRVLFADGMNMGAEDGEGHPTVAFAYALERIALAHPDPQSILVLGLGMGAAPDLLVDRGFAVDVVEINPGVVEVAVEHFGFDAGRVDIYRQDARIFARNCPRRYDAVLMDLFSGDGIPDHLVTAEFFAAIRDRCLAEGGVVGFNTFMSAAVPVAETSLVATIVHALGAVTVMPDWNSDGRSGNVYISTTPDLGGNAFPDASPIVRDRLEDAFADRFRITPQDVAGILLYRDGFNRYAFDALGAQMDYRRSILRALPPPILMN